MDRARDAGTRIDLVEALRTEVRLFDAMFDDEQLRRLRVAEPTHPAVALRDTLERLARDAQALSTDDLEVATEAMRWIAESTLWAPRDPGEDFWAFLPDEATRTRTLGTLSNPDQFGDTMAELFVWGALRSRGQAATRREVEGLSDVVIDADTGKDVACEVKRIRPGTGPRRVVQVIAKANAQIKKSAPPGGGVVFIVLDTPVRPAPPADAVPEDVQPYLDAATTAVRKDNSAVGQVVVTWGDMITIGAPPEPVLIAVRRRSHVIQHAAPMIPPRLADEHIDLGATVVFKARFSEPRVQIQDFAGLVDALGAATVGRGENWPHDTPKIKGYLKNEPFQVSRKHVESAFRKPDAVVFHDVGSSAAVVVKRIKTNQAEFVLVFRATVLSTGEWLLGVACRLYDEPARLDAFVADPNLAFAEVLRRYGGRLLINDGRAWWLPEAEVDVPDDMEITQDAIFGLILSLGGVEDLPGDLISSVMYRVDGRRLVLADLYLILADNYAAARRRGDRHP